MTSLKDKLRALPSIVGTPPTPFPRQPPDHPQALLLEWLGSAIEAGIPEPHAITISTVDDENRADARVLIIKDILEDGTIEIGASSHSPKSQQMVQNPNVCISWYQTAHARAIRIRGIAEKAPQEVTKADWESRKISAKAIASAGKQSTPFEGDRDALIKEKEKELVDGTQEDIWQVWRIIPKEVEFWQGAKSRNHDRLKYTLDGVKWISHTLWP